MKEMLQGIHGARKSLTSSLATSVWTPEQRVALEEVLGSISPEQGFNKLSGLDFGRAFLSVPLTMKKSILFTVMFAVAALPSYALNVLNVVILSETSLRLDAVPGNAENTFTDDGTIELNVFIPSLQLANTSSTVSDNTFTAGTNDAALTGAYIDNYGNGYTNLFLNFDTGPEFSTSGSAFNGSVTITFAASSPADGNLPSVGQTNDIIESFNTFTTIGDYTVVPEPSTYALILVGLIGALTLYRRR